MEKEFEDFWNLHRKRLLLNAPQELRQEYMESSRLDTPMDWAGFVLPIAVGILLQPHIRMQSEVLSWAVILVVVVVLFVLLQMAKPLLQKKKSTIQVVEQIKQYYYERYKKYGLEKMEPWK